MVIPSLSLKTTQVSIIVLPLKPLVWWLEVSLAAFTIFQGPFPGGFKDQSLLLTLVLLFLMN